ncbi:hypothetical protein [Trinickia mobilis]|uniref:hypothetical protein n=1 Tax=Trinickia mobilis TaxID=2816356 RepID=UPI001A8D1943|nr:hypothetical protein [Trinickia mobilis]
MKMISTMNFCFKKCIGEIKFSLVTDYSDDMSRVLSRFGLKPDKSLLVEQSRESAISILSKLIWKGQAYQTECMPRELAESTARKIISENESTTSRYFSNKDCAESDEWSQLTESTFDSGIIVSGDDGRYFCIWFEDED